MNNIHFSDYSLYPDRFAQAEHPAQPVRRNSLTSDLSSTLHPHTAVPITKYNFKIR